MRRVVVVGGGIAGVATAWWLAREGGSDVLLLERERAPGLHSTGRNAGILRLAIDSPTTRELALYTGEFLHAPPPELADRPLVDDRGLVLVEGRDGSPAPWWSAALLERGQAEPLDAAGLARRAPGYVPEGARAWWMPRSGVIDGERLMAALLADATRRGARLRTGAEVARIERDGTDGPITGVRLADGERVEADLVVLAAGGWCATLGAACGAPMPARPTRRHLFVSRADGRVDPAGPVVWDDAAGFYYRPCEGGLMLCLCDGEDCDPDRCVVDPLVPRVLERRLAERLPHLADLRLARGWAAMRTVSEDDTPIVGPDPRVPGLFWVAALGGHGMTLSAGLGRVAAERILGRPVDDEPVAERVARHLDVDSAAREYAPLRDWSPA